MSRVNAKLIPDASKFTSNDKPPSVSSPKSFGGSPTNKPGTRRTKTVRFDIDRDQQRRREDADFGGLE